MSAKIHRSAIVEEGAVIGEGVEIGPFCHVGRQVKLGDGAQLLSHVALAGDTDIGPRTRIFPFASIGHQPQDLKYKGEPVKLVIGEECVIREGVTMNPGTAGGGSLTTIGPRGTFLANSHIAHDCRVGEGVVLSNNVLIAGHCDIGDYVIFGGGAAVHQFTRIGGYSFIGGMVGLDSDVIPFGIVVGIRPATLAGLNYVGLKRRGFSQESIHALRKAYKQLFSGEGPLKERIEDVAGAFPGEPAVQQMVTFLRAGADRAICTPREGKEEA